MKYFLILSVMLALGACTGSSGPISSISKEAADKVWPAATQEARAVRVCMASAIIAEVWTYRLTWEGGSMEEKAQARGVILTMIDDVQNVRGLTNDSIWFETNMFYSLNGLLRHAGPLVKDRILDNVQHALTGNIGALIAELRTTAGQVALTDAMMRDISPIFETETPDIDAAWAACEERLALNLGRL